MVHVLANQRPTNVKPDRHTISVSNAFFVAHQYGLVDVVVGQIDRLQQDGCWVGERFIKADVLIKCIGFHDDWGSSLGV